ncbi:MAG: HAD family hydrolase [Thermoleophilia bacterium]
MIKAVIFDCDGTIVDSRHLMIPFYNWLFAEVGLAPIDETNAEAVDICLSLPDGDVFDYFVPHPADQLRIRERLSRLDPADFIGDLRLEPHALEVLEALRPDYRLAIATNRGHDMTALVRHFGFDDFVETVVTARDVANPKPSPDMLVLAAERMGIPPAEALYIGDTDVDGQAAEAAGMEFICYRRDPEQTSAVRLGRSAADAAPPNSYLSLPADCLGDLRQLPPYLRARNGH